MISFFRQKFVARIILGFLIILAIMSGVGMLALSRLDRITTTMDDLTNRLVRNRQLSQEIIIRIIQARFNAYRYIRSQNQIELDRFNNEIALLDQLLEQASLWITDPNRVSMLTLIDSALLQYQETFHKIVEIIKARQRTISTILDVEELFIETKLSAVRVSVNSLSDPLVFLAFGNAQYGFQVMRLNATKYLNEGNEKYVVLFNKGFQEVGNAFDILEDKLQDETQKQNARNAREASDRYHQGFIGIREDFLRQNKLFNGQLKAIEPRISEAAAQIAADIEQEYKTHNELSQRLAQHTRVELLVVILTAIGVSLVFSLWVSRKLAASLRQVMAASQSIADVDLKSLSQQLTALSQGDIRLKLDIATHPLGISREDEVGQMARAFDRIIMGLHEAQKSFQDMAGYLNEMITTAGNVAQGHLDIEVQVRTEHDALGRAVQRMVQNLRSARDQIAKQTLELKTEIDNRRQAQASLIESEKALRLAKEAAEAASRIKSEFIANMSHELRTPLNGTMAAVELGLSYDLEDEIKEILQIIKISGYSLLDTIEKILNFSKFQDNVFELEKAPFLLSDVLKNLKTRFFHKGIETVLDLALDIPEGKVSDALIGDSGRLKEILENVLDNAIKFNDNSPPQVTMVIQPQNVFLDSITLEFAIADNGIGIAPEHHEMIFDMFTQVDASITRAYDGAGMGLTISRRMARLMNGDIRVESEIGRGSTFFITAGFECQPNSPMLDPGQFVRSSQAAREAIDLPAISLQVDADTFSGIAADMKMALDTMNPEAVRASLKRLKDATDSPLIAEIETLVNDYNYDAAANLLNQLTLTMG